MADPHASGKTNRFVGICIQRGGKGLGATFILRNIIDNQGDWFGTLLVSLSVSGSKPDLVCVSGVELCYELYNPRLQKIEVLKLEKRLDDNLMYLRDAQPEFSTVDPEMKPVPFSPTGEVPVNKVPLPVSVIGCDSTHLVCKNNVILNNKLLNCIYVIKLFD